MDAAATDPFAAKDDLFGHSAIEDPNPRLAELRAACPVHRGSISGHFGVEGLDTIGYGEEQQCSALGFAAVDEVLRDGARFSSSYISAPLGEVIGRTILEMDAPEHLRYRSLLQSAFTDAEMARWEREFVRDIVERHVDRIEADGRADLARGFAFRYPIEVIAAAAGLPTDGVDDFYRQAVLLTNPAADPGARKAAGEQLGATVRDVLGERRQRPGTDLISRLATASFREPAPDGRTALTDDEIVAFVRLLVPAGAQTTYRSLTTILHQLLTRPAELARLAADPALIPTAIEEGLRLEPPLTAGGRLATVDTELAGVAIAAGEAVNVSFAAANRDPARWDDPDEFSLDRPAVAHLTFGQGPHICLGMRAARMELRVALEVLLRRLPGLRLDPSAPAPRITGLTYRTSLSLPVVWR